MVNEIARMLKSHGAVEYGDYTLASGAKSSYYIDIKNVVTRPEVLSAIAAHITSCFDFEIVAGVAVGGVPLAVAVSLASGKPYAIIRAQEKSHGKGGRIIGRVEGRKALLVEDVTTSGGSAVYGASVLREEGALVDVVVTVVDRRAGAVEMLKKSGLTLVSLAGVEEILET